MCDSVLALQPKYILDFIDKQAETDADIVSGTRYAAGGGVFGWDFRRKLISCGANILALTLLQPKARLKKRCPVTILCWTTTMTQVKRSRSLPQTLQARRDTTEDLASSFF